jgi:hypothetical protein
VIDLNFFAVKNDLDSILPHPDLHISQSRSVSGRCGSLNVRGITTGKRRISIGERFSNGSMGGIDSEAEGKV